MPLDAFGLTKFEDWDGWDCWLEAGVCEVGGGCCIDGVCGWPMLDAGRSDTCEALRDMLVGGWKGACIGPPCGALKGDEYA